MGGGRMSAILNLHTIIFVLNACFSLHQSTPLHKAAERGCKDIVTYLVQKGADVASKDHVGVSNLWGYYLNTGLNLRFKDPRTRDPRTQNLEGCVAHRCCDRNATTCVYLLNLNSQLCCCRYKSCTAIHTKTL